MDEVLVGLADEAGDEEFVEDEVGLDRKGGAWVGWGVPCGS